MEEKKQTGNECPQSPIPGMSQEEYAKKLREITEKVKEQNEQEVIECQKCIELLEDPKLDKFQLCPLIHNFILLAPDARFPLRDDLIDLLREQVRQIGIFGKDRKAVADVLTMAKQNRHIDKEKDHAAFDLSQFLTTYFHFMFKCGLQDNEKEQNILKHIRTYMLDEFRKVKQAKEKAVKRCEDILSHKLAGEK